MGKPFNKELSNLRESVSYINQAPIENLKQFIMSNASYNMICIGSGGSLSACYYVAMLYKKNFGLAVAYTPLIFQDCDNEIIKNCKLLFISSSGRNNDIRYAFKRGLKNASIIANICMKYSNPLADMCKEHCVNTSYNYNLPCGKDGFLATNSLLAVYCLAYRCFYGDIDVNNLFSFDIGSSVRCDFDIAKIRNFIVLYGGLEEPVAIDIESKMSEAALGAVLISDYRNFAHGRHQWFDKKGEDSCVVALVTSVDADICKKTISLLPDDIPVMFIRSSLDGPLATIQLLIKSFYFIEKVGKTRGIDPGRPGVPEYGHKLYNLNFAKVIGRKTNADLKDMAICKKCGCKTMSVADEKVYTFYANALDKFLNKLSKESFCAIAFDYDGTLCKRKDRYKKELDPSVNKALEKILEHGVHIKIATGRGDSVKEVFKTLSEKYPSLITIGYYNGMIVKRCEVDIKSEMEECKELSSDLQCIFDELMHYEGYDIGENESKKVRIKKYRCQLTIISEMYFEEMYELCSEIVKRKNLTSVNIWKSTHSMDIVCKNVVNKCNVLNEDGSVLCIGDCGNVDGNDFELLSTPFSLSVDKVSKDMDSCWYLCPDGISGIEATLFYLRHIIFRNGAFKIKL